MKRLFCKQSADGSAMETRLIERINRVMGYGMTCPLHVIADDNKDYILKTKIKTFNSDDSYIVSSKELFAEIFSYIYLNFLEFSYVPNFCLLQVDDETLKLAEKFKNSTNEREKQAYENLKVSKGWNLGVEYIQHVSKIQISLDKFPEKLKHLIINYDARLMNSDRNKNNPNILQDYNGKIWIIDFGLALDMGNIFDNLQAKESMFSANEIYFDKCCFQDYLFDDIERKNAEPLQKRVEYRDLEKMILEVSKITNWFNDRDEQGYLALIISKREQSQRIFCA